MSANAEKAARPAIVDVATQLEVIDEGRCIQLLESTPIGRIGFMSDDGPLVLPVNFAWHDGSVVFRTLDGHKLAAAHQDQRVCFEVDHWSADDRSGWSVVVTGTACQVTDWAEKAQLEQVGLVPWTKGAWRTVWIRVEPTAITGRVLH